MPLAAGGNDSPPAPLGCGDADVSFASDASDVRVPWDGDAKERGATSLPRTPGGGGESGKSPLFYSNVTYRLMKMALRNVVSAM